MYLEEIKMSVESYRAIPNPYPKKEMNGSIKMVNVLVNVNEIPENISIETNPREQNMRTKVAKEIVAGLTTANNAFHILNRGILLSAKDVTYDPSNKNLIIDMGNEPELYGIVDGGHTYRAILQNKKSTKDMNQYVKIEILVGIEDIFEDVAASRNTSVQVSLKAIAELKEYFDKIIKEVIKEEPYAEKIAYKENSQKPIDLGDIITLLFMYNIDRFPDREGIPTQSYTSKSVTLKDYVENFEKHGEEKSNPYVKMKPIIKDIIKLADTVEVEMNEKYRTGNPNGVYGRVTGVESGEFLSNYYNKKMDHKTARGLLYPIISSFRALVKEKDGEYYWITDPLKVWEEEGHTLVKDTISRSRSFNNNPQSTGKDVGLWRQNYQTVLTHYLMEKMD